MIPAQLTDSMAWIDLVSGTAAVRDGLLKPSDWAAACLERIDRHEAAVMAFEHLDRDALLDRARAMNAVDWSSRTVEPRLAGAPFAIKDIFNTRDMPASMGSPIRAGYQPGNDACVVEQAIRLGAIPVGKTTTAEFAVHSSPATRNPWNAAHIAGTSSTGSAVAVACGMVPTALGSQSAGSITRPASYNGVVGFKPTFGTVPRTGVLKICDTLDTIGWLTRNVADARLLFDCLRVRGHNYPQVVRGYRAAERPQDRPWRLAVGGFPADEHAQPYASQALDLLALQLGNRPDVDVLDLDLGQVLAGIHDVHRVIYHKSLSYYFLRDMAHFDKISEIFSDLVQQGEKFSTAEYLEALSEQEALSNRFHQAMAEADVFMALTTAGEAPALGQPEPKDSSLAWTTCGGPAISLPIFRSESGLPYGAQLSAKRYHDYALLDFAERVFPENAPLAEPATEARA